MPRPELLRALATPWAGRTFEKALLIYAECRVAESSYQKDGRTIYGVDIVGEVFDLLAPPAARTEEHVA